MVEHRHAAKRGQGGQFAVGDNPRNPPSNAALHRFDQTNRILTFSLPLNAVQYGTGTESRQCHEQQECMRGENKTLGVNNMDNSIFLLLITNAYFSSRDSLLITISLIRTPLTWPALKMPEFSASSCPARSFYASFDHISFCTRIYAFGMLVLQGSQMLAEIVLHIRL